jgi:hypothetical protein
MPDTHKCPALSFSCGITRSHKWHLLRSVLSGDAMSLSADIKIVVAMLDNSLGVDPFCAEKDARFSVRSGGLIGSYENAAE